MVLYVFVSAGEVDNVDDDGEDLTRISIVVGVVLAVLIIIAIISIIILLLYMKGFVRSFVRSFLYPTNSVFYLIN